MEPTSLISNPTSLTAERSLAEIFHTSARCKDYIETLDYVRKKPYIHSEIYNYVTANVVQIRDAGVNDYDISEVLAGLLDTTNKDKILALSLSNYYAVSDMFLSAMNTIDGKTEISLLISCFVAAKIRSDANLRAIVTAKDRLDFENENIANELKETDRYTTGSSKTKTYDELVAMLKSNMIIRSIINQGQYIIDYIWQHSVVTQELKNISAAMQSGGIEEINKMDFDDNSKYLVDKLIKEYENAKKDMRENKKRNRGVFKTLLGSIVLSLNKRDADLADMSVNEAIKATSKDVGYNIFASEAREQLNKLNISELLESGLDDAKQIYLNKKSMKSNRHLIYAWKVWLRELEIYRVQPVKDYFELAIKIGTINNLTDTDQLFLHDQVFSNPDDYNCYWQSDSEGEMPMHLMKLRKGCPNCNCTLIEFYKPIDIDKECTDLETKEMCRLMNAGEGKGGSYAIPVHGVLRGRESWANTDFVKMSISDIIGGLAATFHSDANKYCLWAKPPKSATGIKVICGTGTCDISVDDSMLRSMCYDEYGEVRIFSKKRSVFEDNYIWG